jgi:hypothetical protein
MAVRTNYKITCAVLTALGAHSAGYAADAASDAMPAESSDLQSVTVTAQRRAESVQDA